MATISVSAWARDSVVYSLPPLAIKMAEKEVAKCRGDTKCLIKFMQQLVSDSRVTYKKAVENLSDAAVNVIAARCEKHMIGKPKQAGYQPVNLVACYKNQLDVLITSIDSWVDGRVEFSVTDIMEELEKQDHFLARAAHEFCGQKVSRKCFDSKIPLFGQQLRVARDNFFASYYSMVVWLHANLVCNTAVSEGACEQNQSWKWTDFVVREEEAPYVGLTPKSAPPVITPPVKIDPKKDEPKTEEPKAEEPKTDEVKVPEPEGTPDPVIDPNKKEDDDKKEASASRLWSPAPFGEPNPEQKSDPEACVKNHDALVMGANSKDYVIKFKAQAALFACDVKDHLDNHQDEPAAVHQSLLIMSLAITSMTEIGENLSIDIVKKYFDWLIAELKHLRDTPEVPGVAELGNLITYLETAKQVNPLMLYKVAKDRYQPNSELKLAFCPWKNAVDSALPGSTKLFPVTVLYCPR